MQTPFVAENGQAAHDQGQFTVGAHKVEADAALAQHGGRSHFSKISAVLRRSLRAGQSLKGMADIRGEYWVTIVKARLRVNLKSHRQAVGCDLNVRGQQAISGGWLFHIAHQQSVKHHAQHGRRRTAFKGEGVVFVEIGLPRGRHQNDLATFGRSRIDIRKMGKTRRVANVAKLGIRMGCPSVARHPEPEGQPTLCQKSSHGSTHATILPTFSRS